MHVLRLTPFFLHEVVTTWPARYDAVGGMQVQILDQSRWLAANGIEQTIITTGFNGVPEYRCEQEGIEVLSFAPCWPEIRSESTGLVGLVLGWAARAVASALKLRKPINLVHLHADGHWATLLVGPIVAKTLKVPLVVTVHCSRLGDYSPLSVSDRLVNGGVKLLEKCIVRNADSVITLTASTRSLYSSVSKKLQHIFVIPDTVDPDRLSRNAQPPKSEALRDWVSSSPVPVIAYVGRVASEKGWNTLIPLALDLRLRSARFIVVGDGPQRERLEAAIRLHQLSQRFRITGFLNRSNVSWILQHARACVVPSVHEELGGVALEALALKTPVAAFAVGGLRQTLGMTIPDFLSPPGDVENLARSLDHALTEQASLIPRLLSAQQWVANHHHPDVVLPRLLEVYKHNLRGQCSA